MRKNVSLQRATKLSPWRKISLGSWRPTGDSSIYTQLELNVEPMLAFCKQIDPSINENHFIGLALAKAIDKYPAINRVIRFGRIYPRENVDVFFHVATDKSLGEDLTGIVVRQAQTLDLLGFKQQFQKKLKQLKSKDEFAKSKAIFNRLPGVFARRLLDFTSFIMYQLNLHSRIFGSPKDPFGSIQITNIGSLNIDNAFVPIAPYTRIPMVVSIGSIEPRPWLDEGELCVKHTVKLGFTFDHRLMDGVHFSQLQTYLRAMFAHPAKHF